MAQTNFTPISLYFSTTAAAVPTAGNLVNGELAINITDGRLYYKDNAGVVKVIAGAGGSGIAGGSNTQVQFNSSGSLAGSANLTFDGTTLSAAGLSDSGNLTFTGTGNRIRGDMSNATTANRLAFQTSTANGNTALNIIPNGTAVTASFVLHNASDPDNASRLRLTIGSLSTIIAADLTGTGTFVPMTFFTGGSERLRIDTSGNLLLGTTTSPTTTEIAGSSVVSGYGIYPFLGQTGTTNTTAYSGLNYFNPTPFSVGNGASGLQFSSAYFAPQMTNNGTGGTAQLLLHGVESRPTIQASASTARVSMRGGIFSAVRANSNDLSANSANFVQGISAAADHAITLPATAFTGNLAGVQAISNMQSGIVTEQASFRALLNIANSTSAQASTVNSASSFLSANFTVGAASGGPGTLTSGFGLNLSGPVINATGTVTNYYAIRAGARSGTGTLTNNFGLYLEDTASTNFIAGNLGVGTASPTLKFSVDGGIWQGNGAGAEIGRITNNSGWYDFGGSSNVNGVQLSHPSILRFLTASTERMRIDIDGNVGIGRTAPVNFGANWTGLEVAGKNSSSGGVIRVSTSDASVQGDFYVDAQATLRTATNHALVFGTNAAERMRITSTGNLLLGTTVDFSTTTNAGSMAVAGVGIYPFTLTNGTANTSLFSSLNIENLTTFSGNNGASSQTYDGVLSSPESSNTGAGGTNFVTVRGGTFQPSILSSGSAARVSSVGVTGNATRGNASDTSTAANNSLTGVSGIVQNGNTAAAGIVTGTATAVQGNALTQNGAITTMYGVRGISQIGSSTAALSSSSTNAYIFSSEGTVGAASGGGGTVSNLFGYRSILTVGATGNLTNFYGLFLDTPTVTGTLTNRWGVYQVDAASPNFFNGNVGIGTASPTTGTFNRQLTINSGASSLAGIVLQNNATGTAFNDGFHLYISGSDAIINQNENAPLVFQVNNAERMRIDSVGSILCGGSTAFTYTGSAGDLVLSNGTTDTPNVRFLTASTKNFGIDSWNASSGSSNQYLRVIRDIQESGGYLVAALSEGGNLTLSYNGSGTSPSNSGTGITFPSGQNASSNANTLDDYEEGVWTPTLAFGGNSVGITYNPRNGTYTKVGNLVTATCVLNLSSKGSSTGLATITGFPFSGQITYKEPVGSVLAYGLNANVYSMSGYLGATTFNILAQTVFNTGTLNNASDGTFTNSTTIHLSITYSV
jgi:hypothetical protein